MKVKCQQGGYLEFVLRQSAIKLGDFTTFYSDYQYLYKNLRRVELHATNPVNSEKGTNSIIVLL